MDRNYFITWIDSYKDKCCKKPKAGLPKMEYNRRSYYLEAVETIKNEVIDYDTMPPLVVVQNFANFCGEYINGSGESGFIFRTSYSAAEDILNYWCSSDK